MAARSRARRSFWSAGRLSRPGSSRPQSAPRPRSMASAAGVPEAEAIPSGDPRMDRANRNGPWISSSAAAAIVMNPCAEAISAAASSSRVFPIPGSPSTVMPANVPPRATASSCWIAASSTGRPTTAPVARRTWSAKGENGCLSGASTGGSTVLPGIGGARLRCGMVMGASSNRPCEGARTRSDHLGQRSQPHDNPW